MKLRVIIGTEGKSFDVPLRGDEVTIGRRAELNSLVIPDNRVSGQHARIYQQQGRYAVEDRGSKNGTFVNGRRLAAHDPQPITHGDVISLANACRITFLETEEPIVHFSDEPLTPSIVFRAPVEPSGATRRLDVTALGPAAPQALAQELAQLNRLVERQAKRLNLLYRLGTSLSSVFSLDDIYRQATSVLFEVTPADRCCILTKDPASDRLTPALIQVRQGREIETGHTLLISETVVRKVLDEGVSLASFYAQTDVALQSADSIFTQGIHSVMCAPLIGRSGRLGVIYADRRDPRETFTEDDLELLNAIAGQTAIAIDNALSYERLSREALARAALARFMPPFIIDQVVASPEHLKPGGSNQIITVLFADIRGFTPLSEKTPPERVVELLNAYFQAMTDIIFAHGGTLDKYIGDGMMALFGAPYRTDDDAVRAVGAAIAMQRRMASFVQELVEMNLPPIGIGIGINTGPATVGYIGSEQRLDYTAIGDTVNLAARLESTAARGQIRISQMTKDAIGEKFPTSVIGSITVKGREQPVQVHEVLY